MKNCLKVVTTLVALSAIYYTLDRDLFWKSVWTADTRWLFIAILLFFPCQFISAYRWYFILSGLDQTIPFRTILHHSVLGQLSTLVLPGQISGDIVRLLSVSRRRKEGVPILLSVVIDKFALLLAVAIFVLVGVLAPGPVSHLIGVHIAALVTAIVALPLVLVFCQYRSDPGVDLLMRVCAKLPFVRGQLIKAVGNLPNLPQMPNSAVFNIIMSAVFLLCFYTAGAYFVALSMHIEINPVDWVAINAIVSFVQIFPLTVGGLGVREGAFGAILSLYGVPFSQAIVCSLTGFALGALFTSLLWLALGSIECETRI